jgi:hypothetical protein
MRSIGFLDASLTGFGADGGIDVRSSWGVAQVKAEMKPVGRPAVQQLAGVASVEGCDALFFSLAGFTPDAIEWADRAGVALFRFDLQGDPTAVNPAAVSLVGRQGWPIISTSWDDLLTALQRIDDGLFRDEYGVVEGIRPDASGLEYMSWSISGSGSTDFLPGSWGVLIFPAMEVVKRAKPMQTMSDVRSLPITLSIGRLQVELIKDFSGYMWTGDFETASEAGRALVEVLAPAGVTLQEFEWSYLTEEESQRVKAEEQRRSAGPITQIQTVEDLMRCIDTKFDQGHSADWTCFWAPSTAEREALDIPVFILQAFRVSIIKTLVGPWIMSAYWSLPDSLGQGLEGTEGYKCEDGLVSAGMTVTDRLRDVKKFVRASFAGLGREPGDFEVRLNDWGPPD